MRYFNLLTSDRLEGFSAPEGDGSAHWRWSLGKESSFSLPAHPKGYELRWRAKVPTLGSPRQLEIWWNGKKSGQFTVAPNMAFEGKLSLPPNTDCEVAFHSRECNSEDSPFVPEDERPLSLCFTQLDAFVGNFSQAKICPMPFSRMEVHGTESFVPCCSPWLTEEYHKLASGSDAWNGPQAQALRASVLDGDYRFCRRDLCQTKYPAWDELENFAVEQEEFHLSPATLAAMKEGNTILADGPSAMTLLSDPRCNLACPSCRPEKITSLSAEGEKKIAASAAQIAKISAGLNRMRLAGDGEALFSPFLRNLIKGLSPSTHPKLKIVELHSNGILLTEENLRELSPGSEFINRLLISVDAGTEDTYRKVRGGNWERLWNNLRWAGAERKKGRFEKFVLLFVYRRENFRSMLEFIRLAKSVAADEVYFAPLLPWERMAIGNYEEEAVHLPHHELHEEFLAVKGQIAQERDIFISVV